VTLITNSQYIPPIDWKVGDDLNLVGHLEDVVGGVASNQDITGYQIDALAKLDDGTLQGTFTPAIINAAGGVFSLSLATVSWPVGRVRVDVQLLISGVRVSSATLIFLMGEDITDV